MRILVTGGAGYVGSVLIGKLLDKNHKVTVLDNLRKGGSGLLPYFTNSNMDFIKGDIRDPSAVEKAVKHNDIIIHLAAVVGQPACDRDPWMARQVNLDGTMNLINKRSKQQIVIFASTLSNYGAVVGQSCTEDMEPKPLTLYAMTKVEAERRLLESGNVIILRPATAFGLSPQMRLDLLFNDFVYKAVKEKQLTLFEPDFMRAFINVCDFSNGLIFGIDNINKMLDKVFNLGDESLNLTKKDLAQRIKTVVDFDLKIAPVGNDPDKRNYRVDFSKIKSLGYQTRISIDDGIKQLVRAMPAIEIKNSFNNPSYY